MASAVNKQIREELSSPASDLECSLKRLRHYEKSRRANDAMDALASRVASKLEEGNYRDAVRLACGRDKLDEHSPLL